MRGRHVFTVRQLTRYLKALLSQDAALQNVSVRGEIADFVRHSSGHVYFTLKDEFSQLRCVLFREDAEALTFAPESGIEVVALGTVTVYEARGQYQLVVRQLEPAGLGGLAQAFERLRRKLAEEGLFEERRKRPLPPFPRKIAVLTSPVGAAVHDVLTTLRARWPAVHVIVIPTAVSGPAAAPEIVRSLHRLDTIDGLEVALLVRGGGSLEELSGFNSEAVARAIAASPVPVVTGIGHETDFTIADMVADRRAPTPTGAAVAATPDRRALSLRVQAFRRSLADDLRRLVARYRRELALLRARPVLSRPRLVLADHRQRLDDLRAAERQAVSERLRRLSERFRRAREKLDALRPEAVLARGYSIARLTDGSVVRSWRQVDVGTLAEVILAEGSADVVVRKPIPPSRREERA
ncbi:MAG TPA: exodeoxyribonuclease VII large subunit [Armatimonadota bacterium]|nr:exodeoxyribonuclease VII large subunit [Armatimonadota bacterium]